MQQQMQWADPMPAAGLLIVALCFGAWALFTGQVPASCATLFMAWLIPLGIGFLIAATICFRRGDILGGTLNLVFGLILALGSGVSGITRFVIPYFFGSGPGPFPGTTAPFAIISPQLDGWILLSAVVVLYLMAIPMAKMTWYLVGWITLVGTGFLMAAIWTMQGSPGVPLDLSLPLQNGLINATGWVFLVIGIGMLYFAMAGIINTIWRRMVLPIGRPLVK